MLRASALFLASLLVAGCGGSAKELPTDVVSPGDRGSPEAPPAVPKASDPEAVKFVQGRIAAATGGKPERLEKLKAFRQKATGRWRWPSGEVNATREVAAVWPGRIGVHLVFDSGPVKENHLVYRDGSARLAVNTGTGFTPFESPNPQENNQSVMIEAMAEQWLPALLPLTDPQTIVFGLKKQPAGNQIADTVQVAIPRCPTFTLWFEANTGAIGLIDYTHAEFDGRPSACQVVPSAYKTFDGLLLPTYFVHRRAGIPVQEWSVNKWEFPDKIEDAAFELKK